jgi:hypothetical protein
MNCPFCPETTLIFDRNDLSGGINVGIYDCPQCNSALFFKNDKLIAWYFFGKYKDNRFYVEWSDNRNTNCQVIIKKETMDKGSLLVATISESAGLTPYNINQKLPFIITFS